MPIAEAATIGDVFVTVTGDINVIRKEHFEVMKNGAITCNSGHFNVELDLKGLETITTSKRMIRDFVEEHTLTDGKRIYVLGEGRLINLAAAEGHPADVMDMSFANQSLSAEFMVSNAASLEKKVYAVPEDLDREIARALSTLILCRCKIPKPHKTMTNLCLYCGHAIKVPKGYKGRVLR